MYIIYINYVGALSSVPGTLNTVQFSIIVSEEPVVSTLTFNTTGGPATYVTWTIDGVNVSNLEDRRYKTSQIVIPNDQLYTAGHYSNILTVTGRLPGVYGVSVTNDRTSQPVTPTTDITIIGIYLKGCAEYICVQNFHFQHWPIPFFKCTYTPCPGGHMHFNNYTSVNHRIYHCNVCIL